MAINYDDIDDTVKLEVADILSKREAIEGALADIQTERALAEIAWVEKEQELKTETNRLTEEMREFREARLVAEIEMVI